MTTLWIQMISVNIFTLFVCTSIGFFDTSDWEMSRHTKHLNCNLMAKLVFTDKKLKNTLFLNLENEKDEPG